MTITATLGAPVISARQARRQDMDILPFHRLQGEPARWANRLLRFFEGVQPDGVEWSVKLSLHGIDGNRFLLGVKRERWASLPLMSLPSRLCIPDRLWLAIQEEMPRCKALYAAFEPDGQAGTYRIYLERKQAYNEKSQENVLGYGFKWHPLDTARTRVSRYGRLTMSDKAEARRYVSQRLGKMTNQIMAKQVAHILDPVMEEASLDQLMYLAVDEHDSMRQSFTVTFQGFDQPVRACLPALSRVAYGMALPVQPLLDHFSIKDPRRLSSLAAGVSHQGDDFMTVYYD